MVVCRLVVHMDLELLLQRVDHLIGGLWVLVVYVYAVVV